MYVCKYVHTHRLSHMHTASCSYTGEHLILVGEWMGRTYGGYCEGLPQSGQSFSEEFQKEVFMYYIYLCAICTYALYAFMRYIYVRDISYMHACIIFMHASYVRMCCMYASYECMQSGQSFSEEFQKEVCIYYIYLCAICTYALYAFMHYVKWSNCLRNSKTICMLYMYICVLCMYALIATIHTSIHICTCICTHTFTHMHIQTHRCKTTSTR
jgi:hypothetical protein